MVVLRLRSQSGQRLKSVVVLNSMSSQLKPVFKAGGVMINPSAMLFMLTKHLAAATPSSSNASNNSKSQSTVKAVMIFPVAGVAAEELLDGSEGEGSGVGEIQGGRNP